MTKNSSLWFHIIGIKEDINAIIAIEVKNTKFLKVNSLLARLDKKNIINGKMYTILVESKSPIKIATPINFLMFCASSFENSCSASIVKNV
jgi:hypothetical protein